MAEQEQWPMGKDQAVASRPGHQEKKVTMDRAYIKKTNKFDHP